MRQKFGCLLILFADKLSTEYEPWASFFINDAEFVEDRLVPENVVQGAGPY